MMKPARRLLLPIAALSLALVAGVALRVRTTRALDAREQPAAVTETREDAYRHNNRGVALLEQFDYNAAAAAFREALRLDPALALARVNVSIALLYALDLDGAQREAEAAARQLPRDPRPQYMLGLIARAQGQTDRAREALERVKQIDPRDVGTGVNLGQILLQQQRYPEAIAAFRAALAEEPFNVTAAYNLGLALTRSGARDEGRKAMEQSQALRASGYGTVFSNNYLEQGRYAEAMASTGAERELVDPAVPDVTFASSRLPSAAPARPPVASPFGRRFSAGALADEGRSIADALAGGVALIDFDGDGDLDVLSVGAGRVQLLRNDRGSFVDVTNESGIARALPSGAIACAVGDYDNDGAPDVLVIRYRSNVLLHNDGGGRFSDASARSPLPPYPFLSTTAAFVDFDHDGDLDIVIAGLADITAAHARAAAGELMFPGDFPGAPVQLVQNNGNGTFTDITPKTHVEGVRHAIAIVPTDYDNRRDVDLLIVTADGAPALFTNLRDGTFRDDAGAVGLKVDGPVTSVATGDFNKDEFPDFFFGRAGGSGVFAVSDGHGRFTMTEAPAAANDAVAAQFVDYDSDGLIDLLVWTSRGQRLLRNIGGGWQDVTAGAFPHPASGSPPPLRSARALAIADVDGDGYRDLIADEDGLSLWRNTGSHRNKSLRVKLSGRVSNRSAIGAKVDVRAGSLRARFESSAAVPAAAPSDVVFGLGSRSGADVVRVLWPSGVLQAETPAAGQAALTSTLKIEELNRKPSSCPFLFTWNGTRFEFVTDFMGGGEIGYWEAPGVRNRPDPIEYVRIRRSQLQPKDGRYQLRVTNELEETMFIDRLALLAVTHAADVEVFPNEGMTDPPKRFRLFQARHARAPEKVIDDHGHDVTGRVAAMDGSFVDDFELSPTRGYATSHTLTVSLGPTKPDLLLLTGWTDYAFSSDNVAASQAGLTLHPPSLEARTPEGKWQTIADDIGIPVGRPQTIVVDLARLLRSGATAVRLVTNMRVYWDQIQLAEEAHDPFRIDRLAPRSAMLRTRGFSFEIAAPPPHPITYDYDRASRTSPWKTMPGAYTREGDVRPLLARSDDRFVIAAPGDEIALSFDAAGLTAARSGSAQTFLLYADGFSKEMDLNSASPDRVEPVPFHEMLRYPYETSGHRRDPIAEKYNTRRIHRSLPPLEIPR